MTCELCKQIKNWEGDNPSCPFTDSESLFNKENWRCGHISKLRRLILEVYKFGHARKHLKYIQHNDHSQVLFDIQDMSDTGIIGRYNILEGALGLYMSWYKSRGCVNSIYLTLDDGSVRPPTFAEIDHIKEGLLILLEG